MKKIQLIFLFNLLTLFTFGQKIVENSFDKFLKVNRIKTSDLTIDMKFSSVLTLSIRSVDTNIFLKLSGRGYPIGIVGDNDDVVILLANDSTISLKSKGLQTYERNGGLNNLDKVFHYEYLIQISQIESLCGIELTSIRINSGQSYHDIEINRKMHESIKKLFKVFFSEYMKSQIK
jgi:hypothetical protein